MTDWLARLFNEPINENPWTLGLLIALALLFVGPLVAEIMKDHLRRRRHQEETMHDPTDPAPLRMADPKMQVPPRAEDPDFVRAREAIASAGFTIDRTGEDDGQHAVPAAGPDEEREVVADPESDRLEKLTQTDPGLRLDPLAAPFPPWMPLAQQHELTEIARPGRPETLADVPPPSRHILAGSVPRSAAPVPAPLVSPHRETCPTCEGTGHMPSISDHLRQSIALVADSGDEIVRAFYAELLGTAPDLAGLFPPDLLTTDETKGQRDKLLKALAALSETYDPADPDKMARLDIALAAFGRSHAAFARPDGTVQGATWEEYAAVKDVLFRTLVAAAGPQWRPEFTASWSQAYDYAAAVMVAAQYRSGFSAPRFPRA